MASQAAVAHLKQAGRGSIVDTTYITGQTIEVNGGPLMP